MKNKAPQYVEEILNCIKSCQSPIVFFRTQDNNRINELKRELLGHEYKTKRELLYYSHWTGLCQVYSEDKLNYSEYKEEGEENNIILSGFENDLRRIYRKAEGKPVIVLIDRPHQDQIFWDFVYQVSIEDKIYESRAIIVVIIPYDYNIPLSLNYLPVVEPPISTEEERRRVVGDYKDLPELEISNCVNLLSGINLHDSESALLYMQELIGKYDASIVKKFKMEVIKKSGLLEIYDNGIDFSSIGGYSEIKDYIKNRIINVINNPEQAKKYGCKIPRGLLLFGNPGTGKTLFAKAIAHETKLPFLLLKTENLLGSLVGQSEGNMKNAIKQVEAIAPCILFVDEVDRFGKRTDTSTDSGTSRRVFSQFLEYLGDTNRKSIIIGTTNVPEQLDEAFIREGRFSDKIPVLLPDETARTEIYKIKVKDIPNTLKDEDFNVLAKQSSCMTGAEIETICDRTAFRGFDVRSKVGLPEFQEELGLFNLDTVKRTAQETAYKRLSAEFCNNKLFLTDLKK